MSVIRWALVPLIAIGCVLLATFIANVVAPLVKAALDQGGLAFFETTTVQRMTQALLIPLGFVWGGARTAPAHRAKVGEALFVVTLLFTGAITYSGLFVTHEAGPVEIAAQACFYVIGAYVGLTEVRQSTQGSVRGWRGLLPPFMHGGDETTES